jgi:hypothetical protein
VITYSPPDGWIQSPLVCDSGVPLVTVPPSLRQCSPPGISPAGISPPLLLEVPLSFSRSPLIYQLDLWRAGMYMQDGMCDTGIQVYNEVWLVCLHSHSLSF